MKTKLVLQFSTLFALGFMFCSVGCGTHSTGLNGNYAFTAVSTPPYPMGGAIRGDPHYSPTYGVAFTEKHGVVTAKVIDVDANCLASSQFSATGIFQRGVLTLKSETVYGEVLTINATAFDDAADTSSGTFTIAGANNTCRDQGTITGLRVPPMHGTFSGDLTDTGGHVIHGSMHIEQMAVADAGGNFLLKMAANFTGSPCFTKASEISASLTGTVIGFALKTDEAPGSWITGFGHYDPVTGIIETEYDISGGACDGGLGELRLTMQ